MIQRLLLERLSLRGICRAVEVSLPWLLGFIAELHAGLPADLNLQVCEVRGVVQLWRLSAEADERWSFVGHKANKQWIWIAIDARTKQVIIFYVGDRSRRSAEKLWRRIPQAYRDHATFATDDWETYKGVTPEAPHEVCAEGSGRTNIIERFNCTLRQRVFRLVREALSASKILRNHIGALKHFICRHNQEVIKFV